MATTRTIELETEIPGPRSREIGERIERAVARPLAITFPIVADSARGATLTDVDGNTFIDFAGGVGSLNVGHSHPDVVAAAHEQLDRFSHTDFTVVPYEPYVALAERLAERAPISGPVKAAFFNAGTEAVENAVKFARAYTGRPAVIAFEGAFHGRTLLSLSLTSKVAPLQGRPRPVRARGLPRPVPERLPRRLGRGRARRARARVHDAWSPPRRSPRSSLEPVQGEGGFIVAPPEFLAGVRRLCDRHGIVLVADEVQTGFGRTGRFFAIEHSGVEPDLICVAKSIANGLPLSGVLGRAEIMDAPGAGGGRRHLRRQPGRAGGRARGARRDRRRGPASSARRAIGETIRARMLAWQERWPRDRRRARPRLDARDRARRRPGDGEAGEGARPARDRGGARSAGCCCSPAASTGTASACSSRS